ncbi:Organic cation transporter protein [Pseudolycoriella hygida]|uniref:Organic cation transporter protein n=1 Tax=Pseudolycoriella hygida TaxID=35572 RepID=A0A9Q0N2C6_9DIPT|nr:Organic cation transporter protein [Pseudolycoriella hygida]
MLGKVDRDKEDGATKNSSLNKVQHIDVEDIPKNDPIQQAMGQFGKWQIFVCATVFLLKFPVAWHQMSIIFLAAKTDFVCANRSIEKCSSDCDEIEFDRSVFSETIITTFDLVCTKEHWANISQTIFMSGILFGSILFGTLADKFGRRIPLVAAVFLQVTSGVATSFVPSFWLFCLLRFITALATGGTMTTSFVLIMEITATKWREVISVLYQIPFNLGHLTLPGFAYFIRDWRHLQLGLSLPSVILISYYWLVPESPRWLITVGRIDDASTVLEKAARMNKLPTENINKDLVSYKASLATADCQQSKGNIWDLFRTPNMRTKTLCICFNWFVCGLGFFGLAQYIGQAVGNIFSNVAISALMGLPGTVACIYTMKRFGRKKSMIYANALVGVSMLTIAIIPSAQTGATIALSSIGIIGITVSFPTAYLYASELFPTVVRNVGVGTASMAARVGSMVAPFVAGLSTTYHWLPPVIFGVVPLLGMLFLFFLPETNGFPLPETLSDGENFGKKKSKDIR